MSALLIWAETGYKIQVEGIQPIFVAHQDSVACKGPVIFWKLNSWQYFFDICFDLNFVEFN